jgi:hypothetical protein
VSLTGPRERCKTYGKIVCLFWVCYAHAIKAKKTFISLQRF